MNKSVFISLCFLFYILSLNAQNKFRFELNSGLNFKKSGGTSLFSKASPVDGVCFETRFLILNNSVLIHGPSLYYTHIFNNKKHLNNVYYHDRLTGFPAESWLPDTINSMTQAHQLSLSYNVGLEKKIAEKHIIAVLFSIGGLLYKLPNRVDTYQGLEYTWREILYGGISSVNLGYAFLFDNKRAIQFSTSFTQIILTEDLYDGHGFSTQSFQLTYSAKVGFLRYF